MHGFFDVTWGEPPGVLAMPPEVFGRRISLREAVFHAEAFALDDDGLGVVQQPVEDGGG